MTPCPTRRQLRRLLLQKLPAATAEALTRHVVTCAACQEALDRIASAGQPDWAALRRQPLRSAFPRGLEGGPPADPLPTVPHRSPTETSAVEALAEQPDAPPGYEILGELGRGGMGVVYKARQVALNRLVGLKMVRDGALASAADRSRFRLEAEAAARLRHPHIIPIYEVGEHAGRLYYSMEYVPGTLAERLRGVPQPPRPAAALMAAVADAVQYAHDHGIIHRDLKPANILLQTTGDTADTDTDRGTTHTPVAACPPSTPGASSLASSRTSAVAANLCPRIADFGLAKRLGDIGHTAYGQVLGTPSYMAPEQAFPDRGPVGPAVDVYALGAVLYEMLTGRPPFLAETPAETIRQLGEDDPLPARRLQPGVPSDLETVCLKCLEKDPARRYARAGDLAADLRRFLVHEPILARPPSLVYRVRKFARRNRAVVAGLAGTFAALLVGLLVSVTFAVREAAERRRANAKSHEALVAAEQAQAAEAREVAQRRIAEASAKRAVAEARIADAVRTFLLRDLLRQADAARQADALAERDDEFEVQENPTVRELLDRAAAELAPNRIDRTFPGQLEVQASILKTVGDAYAGVGAYSRAVEFLTRARDTLQDALGPEHPATLHTLHNLAGAYRKGGHLSEAVALYEWLRDLQVRKHGPEHPETLRTLHNLARASSAAGRPAEAVALYEQVRDARVRKLGIDHASSLHTLHNLAGAYLNAGRLPEAVALYEQVRDARVRTLGPDHPDTLSALYHLGRAYHQAGKLPEAIALLERVREVWARQLQAGHPATLMAVASLATAYHADGRLPLALELLEQVRDAQVRHFGADHPRTLATQHNLALAYRDAGKLPQALRLLEMVRDAQLQKLGADHPDTLMTLAHLGMVYRESGKLTEAIALLERVRDAQVQKLGADHPSTLTTLNNLAVAYQAARRGPEALALLEKVYAVKVQKLGPDHRDTLSTRHNLALAYQAVRRGPEAVALLQEVYAAKVQKLGPDHPDTLLSLHNLAILTQVAGKLPEATMLFERLRDAQEKRLGPGHPNTLTTFYNLAVAYRAAEDRQRALPLFREAAIGLEKRAFEHPLAWRMVKGLADCLEAQEEYAEAEAWRRRWLPVWKQQGGTDTSAYAAELAAHGRILLRQQKYAEAEAILRESVTLCEKTRTNPKITAQARADLARAAAAPKE